ncbi:TPA: hypothetical protein DIU22_05390 [Candidatus Woesebacteria bacterium]|nr:hypothetical protein [Candidatus Woesebacteria bacterium]HLA23008.1 STT3 domain-containing protein [Candidatus Nanoarchaeia archaeon]
MADEFSFDIKKIISFFNEKKIFNAIIIILFLALLIGSSWMRFQNMDLLKDVTNGEPIPIELDTFYFLRMAETIIEQGALPEFDNMRYVPAKIEFSKEITPDVLVFMYRVSNVFGDYSLRYLDLIYPVIFFALGLIAFFFLIYALTNSKITALLSSAFLAIAPTYLYRTISGFSDHDAIGMAAFFSAMLFYTISLKSIEKNKFEIKKTVLLGIGAGALTAITIVSWGGIANYLFMIFSLALIIIWLIKTKNIEEIHELKSYLYFYPAWIFSGVLFTSLFGYEAISVIKRYILSTSGIISLFVLGFIIIDYILIHFRNKNAFIRKNEKYRVIISLVATISLGIIFLSLVGRNPFDFISILFGRFIEPLGVGRTGLTVAENVQTSLSDWISQIGKIFFWLFYLGVAIVGIEVAKGIEKRKNKILFFVFWMIMISGILLSKISGGSILNGSNLISNLFYMGGILLFFGYCVWMYFNDNMKIKPEMAILVSWLFFMLISARGAIRLFFSAMPFVAFMGVFSVVKIFDYWKKTKDDLLKVVFVVLLILSLVGLMISAQLFVNSSNEQTKFSGPTVTPQWQKAMFWLRENTPERSIIVHWWDYGYWVQYLGERPTVTDGGHGVGYWDHLIGRYLLTTPNPDAALSFMKTQNVSYLIIDQTDLGKYPAYSKIGSDPGGNDRYSQIPVMTLNPSQTQETAEGILRVYEGGTLVDEDIFYQDIFLPSGNAIIAAVVLEESASGFKTFSQPYGVFLYNQKQINLPIRYMYYENQLIDFGGGLNATIRIIPKIDQSSSQNINVDKSGAAIYLSPKVSKSLFAQLYILDDAFENYGTVSLVHSEDDLLVSTLNSQGADVGDFVYFQGFRGPIKIWKIDYPSNIVPREEFLRTSGEYAEFDNLKFTK